MMSRKTHCRSGRTGDAESNSRSANRFEMHSTGELYYALLSWTERVTRSSFDPCCSGLRPETGGKAGTWFNFQGVAHSKVWSFPTKFPSSTPSTTWHDHQQIFDLRLCLICRIAFPTSCFQRTSSVQKSLRYEENHRHFQHLQVPAVCLELQDQQARRVFRSKATRR